ncbi:MAG: TIGR03619 family F420-dependent LLM class oxidoreductase [Myxococcota bacterium]
MSVRVGLGWADHPFREAAEYWRWVDLCEDSPVDSLWQSDRLVSREPALESLATMAALAGRTRRLKFGMSVTVVAYRDPLVLAKQCATIDYLSQGRLLPAFGVGPARAPEWRATGRSPERRGRRSDEGLELVSRLWSGETVDFEGEFYHYRQARIAPLPVQQPLPLWIGGSSRAAIRRTARFGTGWLAGLATPEEVAPVVEAIRKAAFEAGRPIDPDHYGAGFGFRFGSPDDAIVERAAAAFRRLGADRDPADYFAVGGAPEILERLGGYRRAGVSKFVLRPLASDAADALRQTRALIEQVLPRVAAA